MSSDNWAALHVSLPGTELQDFPFRPIAHSSFQALADLLCMDEKALGTYLRISDETLMKRTKKGFFSVRESKRLEALIAVVQTCVELFEGDVQAAAAFLRSPSRAFNSKAPLEMLYVGGDAGAVIDLIGRLEHGIVV